MKYLIFSILSLIFLHSLPAGAVKKVEANPINIAVMLIQEPDSAKMASTLDYYGYQYQRSLTPDTSTLETYRVFTHPNGSIIRYKLSAEKLPTVEVTSKASGKEKDQILKNLNFQKKDKGYERRSVGNLTRCVFGEHGSLVFSTIKVERN